MTDGQRIVTGGVDTHLETHVGAVIDSLGRILATESFPATAQGYARLYRWMGSFGSIDKIGVEGTGSYGAGLARMLAVCGVEVVEVNRPNRQARRRRGKSDTADAEATARAALNREATAVPKAGDGDVESIRVLKVARRSAIKARSQAANQIHNLVVNAPDELRRRLVSLSIEAAVSTCARFRVSSVAGSNVAAAKKALRSLSRRWLALNDEIDDLDIDIGELSVRANPALLGAVGVGTEVAATLLVAAGGNPQRLHSEAAFAALCGVSPVEASSGKIVRHRLNTGGNRQANNALWRIVMVRLSCCERTRDFAARKRCEGKTVKETIRILKRSVAREIYQLLVHPHEVIKGADLKQTRTQLGLTLNDAAAPLQTWPTRRSRLERGLDHNNDLAARYHQWLNQQAA